jgi:hypothetical protein
MIVTSEGFLYGVASHPYTSEHGVTVIDARFVKTGKVTQLLPAYANRYVPTAG